METSGQDNIEDDYADYRPGKKTIEQSNSKELDLSSLSSDSEEENGTEQLEKMQIADESQDSASPKNGTFATCVQSAPLEPSTPALPERVGTPSLFSSPPSSSYSPSSPSSSSSLSSRSSEANEGENSKATVKKEQVESRASNAEAQREPLPYSNVISWLLHSYSGNAQSSGIQETETTHFSPTKSFDLSKHSPTKKPLGLSHADIKKQEKRVEEDDDASSACSSQRSNTLARPDLRRVVDPHLSGFLSSPERVKRMRRIMSD